VIAGLVLAAGASSRFGGHKLLARIGGTPLVRGVVEQAVCCALDPVFVVVGREAEAVREALAGLPVEIVQNPEFERGLSTSIRRGMAALPAEVEAVVILLADQPLPSPVVVTRLAEAFRTSERPIVVPLYAGERGNPVLFGASMFPELLRLTGDSGARGLIASDPARVEPVPFDFPPPPDIDTPEDYQRLLGGQPEGQDGPLL
jgi:molybdenum cofactor cytidylyltransferase